MPRMILKCMNPEKSMSPKRELPDLGCRKESLRPKDEPLNDQNCLDDWRSQESEKAVPYLKNSGLEIPKPC